MFSEKYFSLLRPLCCFELQFLCIFYPLKLKEKVSIIYPFLELKCFIKAFPTTLQVHLSDTALISQNTATSD